MPRWEAVATFALVAFILCVIYELAIVVGLANLKGLVVTGDPFVVLVLAFWSCRHSRSYGLRSEPACGAPSDPSQTRFS